MITLNLPFFYHIKNIIDSFLLQYEKNKPKEEQYDRIIDKYSAEFVLDKSLIKALIQTESSFNEVAYRYEANFYKKYIKDNPLYFNHHLYNEPKKISASYGLCQLMYTTALEIGLSFTSEPEILYDPELNIHYGCQFLRKKINLYGLELGILAYNSGHPRTNSPKDEHNYIYLQKIAKYYVKFGGTNELISQHFC